jgi:hypothetical protein
LVVVMVVVLSLGLVLALAVMRTNVIGYIIVVLPVTWNTVRSDHVVRAR